MIYLWVVTMGVSIAYAVQGPLGVVGMSLGLIAGGVGAVVLAAVCRFVARIMASQATPRIGTIILVLAAFVKFPLLAVAWWYAGRLGSAAHLGCAWGLVLSYAILIGWAAAQRSDGVGSGPNRSSSGNQYD